MQYLEVEEIREVAVVRINDRDDKVNTLKAGMLQEFLDVLDKVEHKNKAMVLISSKPGCFVAGADIHMFSSLKQAGDAEKLITHGHGVFNRLASFPIPVVAAIQGAALGGGLELALACHYRIAGDDPKTVFGLPEVKLGLLPGLGGTQRLTRQVGLKQALDMLLTGKNVYSHKARKMGLVDKLIHPHGLENAAIKFALEMVVKPIRFKRKRPLLDRLLEDTPPGRSLIFRTATKTVLKQTAGNYPAPFKIMECVKAGLSGGMKKGLEKEAATFDLLVRSDESRNLVRLFFKMTESRKNPLEDQAREVGELGILGAGLMGAGIAEVSAPKGFHVVMKDLDGQALGRGEKMIWDALDKRVRKKISSPFQRDQILSRIQSTTRFEDLCKADMVIEAVFESLDLKRKILADVEAHCPDHCIFASNTSSLPISEIARDAKRPGQVIGMHYFSPVAKMPLLEIIVTNKTEDWVRATALQVGGAQGKNMIVVNDGPGFYTTRILGPMLNEAVNLLEEGAAIEDLDRAMFQFGFPVGPITLMDEVGIDVGAHVGDVLSEMFRARTGENPSGKMKELLDAGFKGRKNGRGFYLYGGNGKKKKELNPQIYSHFGGASRRSVPYGEIQDRLSLVMVNEAAWCLWENILEDPVDGDLGAILGLGFPPFLGGPFRYMDSQGLDRIRGKLDGFASVHGARFKPAPILSKMKTFYR